MHSKKILENTYDINLFGGPGIKKSTTATALFSKMKDDGFKCEYVPEYAKELVYEKNFKTLSNQVKVFGEQYHRMYNVTGEVDFIITDSPFVMGNIYFEPENKLLKQYMEMLSVELFKQRNNINILLKRNLNAHPYQTYGRNQTLEEAIEKDEQIEAFLVKHNILYVVVDASEAAEIIFPTLHVYKELLNK